VGEAANGAEAVTEVARLHPQVVLMDIRMPIMDGLVATGLVLQLVDPPKVIVLTTFDVDEYVYRALRAGASGFLLKDIRAGQLLDAVRVVAAGEALLAPIVTRRVIEGYISRDPNHRLSTQRLQALTPRERVVLTLIGTGASNSEIAQNWSPPCRRSRHM
jgi:DNA-binding NarL/FixJ family response regulator